MTTVTTAADYVPIPGGRFDSVVPADGKSQQAMLAPFSMRTEPVTNAEFLAFVKAHPQWQKDRVSPLFADSGYLSHWSDASAPTEGFNPQQPVTRISWYAARAYCASEQARLPNWYEWELAAAADEHRSDAREDERWRERILSWYARPSGAETPAVGGSANVYGVRDLHGLVWEWVEDFNSLIVNADNRATEDEDRGKFCGSGALNLQRKEQYAILMRIAMLSSLQPNYTTGNLGFRCVRNADTGAAP